MLARNMVTWSLALVPCLIYVSANSLSIAALATAIVATSVLALVLWVATIAYNVKQPGRGVAERFTGTYLVPE